MTSTELSQELLPPSRIEASLHMNLMSAQEDHGAGGVPKARRGCGRRVSLILAMAALIAAGLSLVSSWLSLRAPYLPIGISELARPAHSFNTQMDEELRRAWKEMDEGRIAYDPKRELRQGDSEEVRARISREPDIDLREGFESEVWIERLRVSGSMAAYLSGNPNDFEIVALSSPKQALVGSFTDWNWEVTPLSAGNKTLNLRVVATIRLSNGETETKDILVKDTQIHVEVNRAWAAKRFIQDHWQWLLGSPLLVGLITWIASRVRVSRKRKRSAGF